MEQEVKTVVRKSIPLDKIFVLPSKNGKYQVC